MKNICLIGAGNIGSRHLQGLKKTTTALSIEVIDPSEESLHTAQERYRQISSSTDHNILFNKDLRTVSKNIDLAIIATSSNVRRQVLEKLLSSVSVKYLILEKILFQKKEDYYFAEKLLEKKGVKTWVNFSMRTMPFYHDLKDKFNGKIQMNVSGSQYGLITNAIHFLDYIAFLTDCYEFTVTLDGLYKGLIKSKRNGFSELNGTINVCFKDGSTGSFTCYPEGDAPFIIEIFSSDCRYISKESERKVFTSSSHDKWIWKEIESNIPYQSDMTNIVAESILNSGRCSLAPYSQASKIHLQFLENLLIFLNKSSGKKFDFYPFT